MDWLKTNNTGESSNGFAESGLSNGDNDAFVSAANKSSEDQGDTMDEKQNEISKEIEQRREKREAEDKAVADQLIVIHGAKVKFNSHLGEFKVLSDVPTTQDKLTGTIVEKNIPNFTFYDGFTLNTLAMWQDFGTMKVQENEVLIKKSFNPGIGIMPGSSVPEPGKVEFVNSGQIHVPESINTAGAPLPEESEDNSEYVYYSIDGHYLGGLQISSKVFISTQAEYDTVKKEKKWSSLNKEENALKENGAYLSNNDFCNNAYLVFHEASLTGTKTTALWIAHTVNNALHSKYKRGKTTFNALFKTGYSSVAAADKKTVIKITNKSPNEIFARYSVIDVFTGKPDPTSKSYFWDGLDIFTKKGELDQPKFKQYKSVTISTSTLETAVEFWEVKENKRKVNPNSVINDIFKSQYEEKKVTDGTFKYDTANFTGKRNDTQKNDAVSEHLVSTGFQSGTLFWTTKK